MDSFGPLSLSSPACFPKTGICFSSAPRDTVDCPHQDFLRPREFRASLNKCREMRIRQPHSFQASTRIHRNGFKSWRIACSQTQETSGIQFQIHHQPRFTSVRLQQENILFDNSERPPKNHTTEFPGLVFKSR